MKNQLGILGLLQQFGFDSSLKTKLVRHQDRRYDVRELIEEGWFELYQSLQAGPIFHKCDQIVCFVGDGGTRARFIGVYKVIAPLDVGMNVIPKSCPYQDFAQDAKYRYQLEHQASYGDLENRVVIEWGDGALAWHQHFKDKPVIEILPPGKSLPDFTDYLGFTLTHQQLKNLIKNSKAHRDWHASLSSVAGVYLILSEKSGKQYVGSAYGTAGFWGRWIQYAANGHGGNELLKDLLKKDSSHPEDFRYSVLQVLPKTTVKREVIRWETQYKLKLGSRATGLNAN